MDLTHVIAERENKKIYRDGAKAIKVFAEGYVPRDCPFFIQRIW